MWLSYRRWLINGRRLRRLWVGESLWRIGWLYRFVVMRVLVLLLLLCYRRCRRVTRLLLLSGLGLVL